MTEVPDITAQEKPTDNNLPFIVGLIGKGNDTRLGALIAILIGIIFLFDIATPLSLAVWTLYLIPLFLTAYIRWRYAPVYGACAIVFLSIAGIFSAPQDTPIINALVNRVFFSMVITVIAYFIWTYREKVIIIDNNRDELSRAHTLLTSHIGNSPLAIIEFDAQFRITLWSGDATGIFGWDADEVTGKAIGEFPWVYEEDAGRVSRISADMMDGKSSRNMHANRNYRKDGSVIECEWYNSALRDENGNLVSIFSQVLDVTARNRAEAELEEKNQSLNIVNEELSAAQEELRQNIEQLTRAEGDLRESGERLRFALETIHTGAWDLDLVDHTSFRSEEHDRIFGYPGPLPQWTYEMFLEHILPEDRAPVDAKFRHATETGSDWNFECRIRRIDGTIRWILAAGRHHRDAYGNMRRMAGIVQDVTERRLAEAKVQENGERLRALYASMTEGVAMHEIIYDTSGKATDYRILEVNPAFSRITGIPEENAEGTLASALYGTGEPPYLEIYARVAETRTAEEFETSFEAMGKSFHISVFSPEKGRFATVFVDISERKKTETNQDLVKEILGVLNRGGELHALTLETLRTIRESGGFDAVGLRMKSGDDYPYYEQIGFSGEFQHREDFLCARLRDGTIARDAEGRAVLECTCGLVISGRTDSSMPCFTAGGSFWTNKSPDLLALPSEADPRTNPRNRCIHDGYQSIAIVPVRSGREIIGLLQLNDRREGRFTADTIRFFENLADNIGLAVTRRQAEEELERKNQSLNTANEELRAIHEELQQNVDELARSGHALRETSQYLENLITYANAPIIVWNPEFRITRFNHAFEHLTGRRADEAIGQPLDILFPKDQRKELMAMIRRTLTGEQWENVEIPIQHVGGDVKTVLWNSATLYEPDGRTVSSIIAQGQDITSRKKAEEALRDTTQYLENLITYANAPIIVWNPDLRIIRFNRAFEELTGRPASSVAGKNLDILFPPDRRKELTDLIRRTLTGEHWENAEIPIQHVGGDVKTVLWNSATLYEPDGRTVSSVIAQGQDITSRKRAEHELRDQNARLSSLNEELTATQEELQQNIDELAKSEANLRNNEAELKEALVEKDVLLSEIHHRVKNNLAAFISLLSLEGTYEETPEGQALKKDLQNRARSMALIHETLYRTRSYASVDMGVYLNTLMEQIAGSYSSAKAANVEVHADGVFIDISRATPCGLIINELVTNSFKYAFPVSFDCEKERHKPCTIRVSMEKDDSNYILRVSDNGIGLPAGFDIKSAQSLGLKLVSFLARHQLRAKIAVGSGEGTEFIITFANKQ